MARARDRIVDLLALVLEVLELGEVAWVGEGFVDAVLGSSLRSKSSSLPVVLAFHQARLAAMSRAGCGFHGP